MKRTNPFLVGTEDRSESRENLGGGPKERKMKRFLGKIWMAGALWAFAAIAFSGDGWARANVVQFNERLPFAAPIFVPCAADGVGEVVMLSGTINVVAHTTIDNTGGFHVEMHAQPQGISGTGLTTGDTYRGVGVSREHMEITGDGFPIGFSFVNVVNIIGPGSGNNLLVHETIHTQVNNNGDLTANIENIEIRCQ
jgi:hypothetical protein